MSGLWIESSGPGESRFVTPTKYPGYRYIAKFATTVTRGARVQVRVGCGDSGGGRWTTTSKTDTVAVSTAAFVMNAWCDDGGTKKCNSPSIAASAVSSSPRYPNGFCTDGAERLWFQATGKWVGWNPAGHGDAKWWDDNGKGKVKVTSVPMVNSIMVDNASGDPRGHVAWVVKVKPSGSAVTITVWEMNGSLGLWNYNVDTYTWTPARTTLSFIVAPFAALAEPPV